LPGGKNGPAILTGFAEKLRSSHMSSSLTYKMFFPLADHFGTDR